MGSLVFRIAGSGGGGGIPESITAGENLAHWYKMNEGSTSAATDYGLSASSTDMTLSGGVTADETGPSAIGSPDAIKFDGTDGIGSVFARSDDSNTALGDLFDTNTWSVSWWMKDDTASYNNSNWHHWIGCVDSSSWQWPGAWGVRYYYSNFVVWGYAGGDLDPGHNMWTEALAMDSWRHYVLTFNDTSNEFEAWIDGVKTIAYDADGYLLNIDTSVGTNATNMFLSIGGLKHPAGTAGQYTAPYFSDLRFYDITLSDANIAAIYAGDW
jgi:hypothetical protein